MNEQELKEWNGKMNFLILITASLALLSGVFGVIFLVFWDPRIGFASSLFFIACAVFLGVLFDSRKRRNAYFKGGR